MSVARDQRKLLVLPRASALSARSWPSVEVLSGWWRKLAAFFGRRQPQDTRIHSLPSELNDLVQVLDGYVDKYAMSSTHARELLQRGACTRGLLVPSVAAYAQRHSLYAAAHEQHFPVGKRQRR